jgi:raffinose/stachyose/melibiose transport system substrate-binding protein
MILFYNKTLFEQKGYQPPKTFDEMVALGEQMVEDDIIPFASDVDPSASQHWQVDYFYAEYLNAIAGPQATYEALTGKRSWTDPLFAETFSTMSQQVKDGWFMGGVDKYFSMNWDQAWTALANGEAGMTIQGTWMFQSINTYFEGTGNDWGWAPIPRKDGKNVFAVGIGSAWGINKNSEHPDQAAEFLNLFFQPEVQAELMRNMSKGCIAAGPVAIEENLMAGLDPRQVEVYTAMNQALSSNDYSYTTWTFWPPKLQVFMQSGLEKIFNDQMTIEEFLAEADSITQEALKEGVAPPIPVR